MKKNKFLYHLLFWSALYILWVLIFRSYSISITRTLTIEFCYLIFITIDYYTIADFIIPRFLIRKKYLLFVLFTIGVIAISAGMRAVVALEMNRHFFNSPQIPDFATLYIKSLVNISLWVLLVTIGKMLIDRIETQQQVELLEKERVKNELNYLKAQINPHALFNSLNTIYGHIDKGNQVARNILLQFSELLRYQLYDCGAEKVKVEKEIDYVRNYVAFQRLRKDEKLLVDLHIGNIENDLEIAPLLLVVLIENAFKYVSSFPDKENKIYISLFTKDKILHGTFFNTKEVLQAGEITNANGIGVTNLKRRLELLYPEKYELRVNDQHGSYETNLTIDLL